jgi:hypothetical protein
MLKRQTTPDDARRPLLQQTSLHLKKEVGTTGLVFDRDFVNTTITDIGISSREANVPDVLRLAPGAVHTIDHKTILPLQNGLGPTGRGLNIKRAKDGERHGRKVLLGLLVVLGIHGEEPRAQNAAIHRALDGTIPEAIAAEPEDSKELIGGKRVMLRWE